MQSIFGEFILGGHMRKQRYTPYFFDVKYEKRTYKHIGKDYGDCRTADRGLIRNFLRWYRKKLYNRKELKYKFCNTYEEWKLYLLEKKFCNTYDKQNMVKFLNDQKRSYEKMFESIKTVIIPIYIALYSGMIAILNKFSTEMEATETESRELMFICVISMTLFILTISFYWIFQHQSNIYFYEDCIDCLNNE